MFRREKIENEKYVLEHGKQSFFIRCCRHHRRPKRFQTLNSLSEMVFPLRPDCGQLVCTCAFIAQGFEGKNSRAHGALDC